QGNLDAPSELAVARQRDDRLVPLPHAHVDVSDLAACRLHHERERRRVPERARRRENGAHAGDGLTPAEIGDGADDREAEQGGHEGPRLRSGPRRHDGDDIMRVVMSTSLWLIPALPLAGALINMLFG